MKIKYILSILLLQGLFAVSSAQTFQWAKKAGGYSYDYGRGISADNYGNFYVTGEFEYKGNFGGIYVDGYGLHDIFVAKYNSSGNIQWVKKAGASKGDVGHAISCDAGGNVYVTGEIEGKVNFSGITVSGNGSVNDIFVAKYNSSGNIIWAKNAGGWESDKGLGIANYGGNVYVTGYIQGSVKFGSISMSGYGSKDAYLAKYDSNGNVVWAKKMGGSGSDAGMAVATDGSGNIYVTGYFSGTSNFLGTYLSSSGGPDIFIAKVSPDGVLQWVKKAGGSWADFGRGIAVDNSGRVFVAGDYRSGASFSGISMSASGDGDAFIACYSSSSGSIQWVKKGGGSGIDAAHAISIDGNSNTYITGFYAYGGTFGGTYLSGSDKKEVFVASYTSSGSFRWAKKGGGYSDENDSYSEGEAGLAISAEKTGNVYCSGSFLSNIVFDGTTLSKYNHNDIYITKIGSTGSRMAYEPFYAYVSPVGPASFCKGQSLELITNQDSGYTYQWKKDDAFIPGATQPVYNATAPGNYSVKIISGSRIAWSAPVTISVNNCHGQEALFEEPDSLHMAYEASLQSAGSMDTTHVNVYPNPGTGTYNMEICLQDAGVKTLKINVANSLGQVVYAKDAQQIEGCIREKLELENSLPGGVYLLQVSVGDKTETTKIVLRR